MKMDEAHIVPLSKQVIQLLKEAKGYNRLNNLIFEGANNANKPLSENTLIYAVYRLG